MWLKNFISYILISQDISKPRCKCLNLIALNSFFSFSFSSFHDILHWSLKLASSVHSDLFKAAGSALTVTLIIVINLFS